MSQTVTQQLQELVARDSLTEERLAGYRDRTHKAIVDLEDRVRTLRRLVSGTLDAWMVLHRQTIKSKR